MAVYPTRSLIAALAMGAVTLGLALTPGCSNKPDLPEMSETDAAKLRDLNVPPMGSPKDLPSGAEDTTSTDGFNPPIMAPGKGGDAEAPEQ